MPIRQKLFLVLSLMAMVPLLFLLFEVVDRIEKDLESRAATELFKTLGKMSHELNNLMDNQRSLVKGLAKVPIVKEFGTLISTSERTGVIDKELLEAKTTELAAFFFNYHTTVPSIQALRFTDTSGKTLAKVKEGKLVPTILDKQASRPYVEDISYKSFFQRAVKTEEIISISDFELGKVSGEVDFCPAMVRYSVPIRDEIETLQGVLVVNMWGKRFDDALQAALGGYPGNVYMAEINRDPDRDGIYLYHKDADKRFSNQLSADFRFSNDIDAGLWEEITKGEQQGFVVTKDERMFFYKKHSPFSDRDNKWLLLIETKRDTILAPITSLRDWIIYLIIAVLIISLLVARWVASRLARPVDELAQIITNYANGDHSAHYNGERSDEIGHAGKAFNYLSDSLEKTEQERDKAELAVRQSERLAAVGQMAAGIGHEINNPLMNIMSLASLIEESIPKDNNQIHDDINALQNEGKRCARIVQGILNFARETEPHYQRFDLGALIDETLSVFQHRLQVMNISLDVDVQNNLMVNADYGQLQQVLMNIIINAMHTSPEDSIITICAKQDGDNAVIEVLDNGTGIKSEDMPRVFSPFFTTKPEGSGTGLGLSVSYGIIKKHGGTITLENREERGVRVQITIPVDREPDVNATEDNVSNEVRDAG